jgi:N-acetylglucosaminyl-diphospho-decaprenol L-rhamnosyltransferase
LSARDLTLVVVTWECADHLGSLVRSLNTNLDRSAELIVIDNGSGDDPESVARGWRGRTRFRRLDSNLGFGGAANVGVEMAETEAVVLLNPDTEILDRGVSALAEFALANHCLAGPRLLNPDRSTQPSAGGRPVGLWPWIGAVVPGAAQPKPWLRRTEPWRLVSTTPVAWLSGACIAGPRLLLRSLGPFDPAIHLYAEDMDLGLRASQAGTPSFLCPTLARVVHRRRASSERRWPQGPEAIAASNRRAVLRRAHGPRAERWGWRAQRSNLRLRVLSKRVLRRDAEAERRALAALRAAAAPLLPPPAGPPPAP